MSNIIGKTLGKITMEKPFKSWISIEFADPDTIKNEEKADNYGKVIGTYNNAHKEIISWDEFFLTLQKMGWI